MKRLILALAFFCLTGCSIGDQGPEFLTISPGMYAAAFDAADEVVRAEQMPATLRDRRSGVIETEPRIAGSILEPWRGDNATFEQSLENTISFQRRRVRVEFTPAGFRGNVDDGAPLSGPDIMGLKGPMLDLTRHDGDIEVRVWAYLERSYTFGVRRSTWSQRTRSQMQIISPYTGETLQAEPLMERELDEREWTERDSIEPRRGRAIQPSVWAPISRDPAFERKVLEAIRKRLERAG